MVRPAVDFSSLEQVLRSPEQLQRLKMSATEDFCLENILFYEEYMLLAEPGRYDKIYTSTIRGTKPSTATNASWFS